MAQQYADQAAHQAARAGLTDKLAEMLTIRAVIGREGPDSRRAPGELHANKAKALSAKRRKEIGKKGAEVRWGPGGKGGKAKP